MKTSSNIFDVGAKERTRTVTYTLGGCRATFTLLLQIKFHFTEKVSLVGIVGTRLARELSLTLIFEFFAARFLVITVYYEQHLLPFLFAFVL